MLCREHALNSWDVVGHFHNALPWSHSLSILATHPVVFRLCSLQLQWLCSESIDFNEYLFISLIKGVVNGESDKEALPLILDLNTDHVTWHAGLVALGIDWSWSLPVLRHSSCVTWLINFIEKTEFGDPINSSFPSEFLLMILFDALIFVPKVWSRGDDRLIKYPVVTLSPCKLAFSIFPHSKLWDWSNHKYVLARICLILNLKVDAVSLLVSESSHSGAVWWRSAYWTHVSTTIRLWINRRITIAPLIWGIIWLHIL